MSEEDPVVYEDTFRADTGGVGIFGEIRREEQVDRLGNLISYRLEFTRSGQARVLQRIGRRSSSCGYGIPGFYVPESVKEEHFYKSPTFDV